MNFARMFFMSSMMISSQSAVAMGPSPEQCRNLYSARVVKAEIVQDGREFKLTTKPELIVLRRGVDARMRVTVAVAGESEAGNKDEGQIWIGYGHATFTMGDCSNVDLGTRQFVIDAPFEEDRGAKPGSILNQGISVHNRTAAKKVSYVSFRVRWVDNDGAGKRKPLPPGRAARASKG